jgi:hypothetical protein
MGVAADSSAGDGWAAVDGSSRDSSVGNQPRGHMGERERQEDGAEVGNGRVSGVEPSYLFLTWLVCRFPRLTRGCRTRFGRGPLLATT